MAKPMQYESGRRKLSNEYADIMIGHMSEKEVIVERLRRVRRRMLLNRVLRYSAYGLGLALGYPDGLLASGVGGDHDLGYPFWGTDRRYPCRVR